MELRITLDGDIDGRAALSLKRWLNSDPQVVRRVAISTELSAEPMGQMSGAFDVIVAVVSDATALGSLMVAYRSWREARPRMPAAVVEHKGVVVHLSDTTPEQVIAIIEKLADAKE